VYHFSPIRRLRPDGSRSAFVVATAGVLGAAVAIGVSS
jgi:hypothetical protein